MVHLIAFPKPAPSLWSDQGERPRCPKCDMRMIVGAAPQRSFECLRCGHLQDRDTADIAT
jgi:DNA-directed RNA polymerase subunit RPC12/RpoP